jgi:hypothetical protein
MREMIELMACWQSASVMRLSVILMGEALQFIFLQLMGSQQWALFFRRNAPFAQLR